MKTRMQRLRGVWLVMVALGLALANEAGAQLRPLNSGNGSGGSLSITGNVGLVPPLTFVPGTTNIQLPIELANLKTNPPLAYATNYNRLLSAYTNIISVNWSNDALSSGLNLTNIATTVATAGTLIDVGPGTFWIGTNEQSLIKPGVAIRLNDTILTMGTAADTTPRYLLDDQLDGLGARDFHLFGNGRIYLSNNQANLLLMSESDSTGHLNYRSARTIGVGVLLEVNTGSLVVNQEEYGKSDGYDFVTGTRPQKIHIYGGWIEARDSLFEFPLGFTNLGDCVIRVAGGSVISNAFTTAGTAGIQMGPNVIIDGGVWDMGSQGVISAGVTNANNSGSYNIIQNAYIKSATNATKSALQKNAAGYGTELTLRNTTVEGGWLVDPINHTSGSGFLTLENVRVISGPGATNAIRADNAGSQVRLIGVTSFDKPLAANVTLLATTNTISHVRAAGGMNVNGAVNFGGAATFTNSIEALNDFTLRTGASFISDAGANVLFQGGFIFTDGNEALGKVLGDTDGAGTIGWVADAGGSGGGGTNFPNVNILAGNTNLVLSAGVRKAFHNQTNGSHGINLNLAVPESGYEVVYSVSNSGSSDITVTFYTNSVAANPYDIATKTNVNTFTAAASAITKVKLTYTANGLWLLDRVDGPASILKFGSGITATTNGANGLDVTISASATTAWKTNGFLTVVSNTVTPTTVLEFTLPANTLETNQSLEIELNGRLLNNSGAAVFLTNFFSFGGSNVLTMSSASISSAGTGNWRNWNIRAHLYNQNSKTLQGLTVNNRVSGITSGLALPAFGDNDQATLTQDGQYGAEFAFDTATNNTFRLQLTTTNGVAAIVVYPATVTVK